MDMKRLKIFEELHKNKIIVYEFIIDIINKIYDLNLCAFFFFL